MAKRKGKQKVIHHSDRWVQYLCDKYVTFLTEHGFKISCSARGNPYDNMWAESFMKTLKVEEIYLFKFETILDVLNRIPEFIEEVYNKKRIHSSLGYVTPEEFELKKIVVKKKINYNNMKHKSAQVTENSRKR